MSAIRIPQSVLHQGGDQVSTGVHEITVACRGLRWPRKKAENKATANDYEAVALAA